MRGSFPVPVAPSIDPAVLAKKADLVSGLVPTSEIPPLALTSVVTVTNRAAMLALTSTQVQPGDIAVDTSAAETRGSYILAGTDPSVLGNWVQLPTPNAVVPKLASLAFVQTSSQAIPTYGGTGYLVPFNVNNGNDDTSIFAVTLGVPNSTVANSTAGSIKPLKTGLFLIRAQISFTGGSQGQLLDALLRLGATTIAENKQTSPDGGGFVQVSKLNRVTQTNVTGGIAFTLGAYITANSNYEGSVNNRTTLEVAYLGV